jgi:8-oxo-dGTP diphosphatase
MKIIVAGVIERADRKLLIGQRRKTDTSPLKWEFPGGKIEHGETPEEALARELLEETGATLEKCLEIGRVRHKYPGSNEELEIRFFAAAIRETEVRAIEFEEVRWVFPRELGEYDFLAANAQLVAQLATGKIKPSQVLEARNDS